MGQAYMPQAKSVEWETPQALFDELDREFHFTVDVCATPDNAKCERYFTKDDNGLWQDWAGEHVYCNPPYGREIKHWVQKASELKAAITVMLLPVRTDTKWFHDYIYGKAEIRFIKGRLKFGNGKHSATFPSMIVIFRNTSLLNPPRR